MTRQEALQAVCSDRLLRHGIFVQVPSALFMPPARGPYPFPAIAVYAFRNGRLEQMRPTGDRALPIQLPAEVRQETYLWVRESEFPAVRQFANELLAAAHGDMPDLPKNKRAEALRKSALTVVEDLFEKPSPENLERSVNIVGSFVQVIMKDPTAFFVLANLSSHDPYTLQHSVGTAVNAIIVGRKIGLKEEELQILGLAGLLHDIGKVRISPEIINKEGPLNEVEWTEMKKHPVAGFDIVKSDSRITDETKRAILEHHEDRQGTGYPRRLSEQDLHLYSKIIGLCDVFNALTTRRSYAPARSPFAAFELIRDKMSHKIDPNLFSELVLIYGGKLR